MAPERVGSKEVRQFMVDALKAELVGPQPGLPAIQTGIGRRSSKGEEILRAADPPRMRYGAGVLFPRRSVVQEQEDEDTPEVDEDREPNPSNGDSSRAHGSTEIVTEADTEQEINRANEYLPSGMGLTAVVQIPETLVITVEAGRYEGEELPGQRGWKDKDGRVRAYRGWRRIPIRHTESFTRDQLLSDRIHRVTLDTGTDAVKMKLHVYVREPGLHGTPKDARIVTFTLINDTVASTRRNETCLFQCSFSVSGRGERCFLEYPEHGSARADGQSSRAAAPAESERNMMRLLYRYRRIFAVGHGCAPEWNDTVDGTTDVIRTEVMPGFEVAPIFPTTLQDLDLNMERLAQDEQLTTASGAHLADLYETWIESLESVVNARGQIPETLLPAAKKNIAHARVCLDRIRSGVKYLCDNPEARRAFALMNRAMLMQQLHYALSTKPREWTRRGNSLAPARPYERPQYAGVDNRWRPFQFAFVLLNLVSIVDPAHTDRSVVDIIWFPTGGGKTEAYLGLSAFAILWRRMRKLGDSGTVVLMRYTLRLLTTQQYQRASSLICALEYLRREGVHGLGTKPITIGLWVGGSVTPNRDTQAREALQRMSRKGNSENRFVLLSCPWCGAGMGAFSFHRAYRVVGYRTVRSLGRVAHICGDSECEFSREPGLPVLVSDEAIYDTPPTLLIGTVDKFALLPWYPAASAIFGIRDGQRENPPPDLIVQDELHLISGPLGSMVGHYETVIGELCVSEPGCSAKIVASTATISRARQQVKSLYAREQALLFPPQGLEWGDSFFAEERQDLPGRYYLGIFATGLPSQQTTVVRVMSSILQSPKLVPDADESAIDPYWTVVTYFNSIRELGSAATLVSADIQEYMKVLHSRLGLSRSWRPPVDRRRWIRSPTLELTSRVKSGEISSTLQRLFEPYSSTGGSAVDVCLATNMIQVGLDVGRLGLMVVAGQPKTTAEYIQATSRVGRRKERPGLVVVLLSPSKPRDRSHYEHFRPYHERLDSAVEPTSVTPFAVPVRDRALHALIVTMVRFWGNAAIRETPDSILSSDLIERIRRVVSERIKAVDPEELPAAERYFDHVIDRWSRTIPSRYGGFGKLDEELPLIYPYGSEPHPGWEAASREPPWPTPSSMRSVDANCELGVIGAYDGQDEDHY